MMIPVWNRSRHGCLATSIPATGPGPVGERIRAVLQEGGHLRAFSVLFNGLDGGPAPQEHRAHRAGLWDSGADDAGILVDVRLGPCADGSPVAAPGGGSLSLGG